MCVTVRRSLSQMRFITNQCTNPLSATHNWSARPLTWINSGTSAKSHTLPHTIGWFAPQCASALEPVQKTAHCCTQLPGSPPNVHQQWNRCKDPHTAAHIQWVEWIPVPIVLNSINLPHLPSFPCHPNCRKPALNS